MLPGFGKTDKRHMFVSVPCINHVLIKTTIDNISYDSGFASHLSFSNQNTYDIRFDSRTKKTYTWPAMYLFYNLWIGKDLS